MIEKLTLRNDKVLESAMGNIEIVSPQFDNHEIGEKINEIIDFCNKIESQIEMIGSIARRAESTASLFRPIG